MACFGPSTQQKLSLQTKDAGVVYDLTEGIIYVFTGTF